MVASYYNRLRRCLYRKDQFVGHRQQLQTLESRNCCYQVSPSLPTSAGAILSLEGNFLVVGGL